MMSRLTPSPRKNQHGAALAFGLVFLLITTILAVGSMRGSQLQERMTSSMNHQTIAFAASERGASEVMSILTGETFWATGPGSQLRARDSQSFDENGGEGTAHQSPPGADNDNDLTEQIRESLNDDLSGDDNAIRHFVESVLWDETRGHLIVMITGESLVGNQIAGKSTIRLAVSGEQEEITRPAFAKGIIANNNIEFEGHASLRGAVHANADINLVAELFTTDESSSLSAGGVVSAQRDCPDGSDECVSPENMHSGVDTIRIPSAIEAIACLMDDQSLSIGFEHQHHPETQVFSEYCEQVLEEGSFTISRHGSSGPVKPEEIIILPDCALDLLDPDAETTERLDLLGEVYFCDGDFDAGRTSLVNGTILATGDILLRSDKKTGEAMPEIDAAFIAGANIFMGGGGSLAGIFWANGDIAYAGNGSIKGLLMASGRQPMGSQTESGGSIYLADHASFEQAHDLGRFSSPLRTHRSGKLIDWASVD